MPRGKGLVFAENSHVGNFTGTKPTAYSPCEQSRKLRISVTKIENGPDRFF